MKNIRYKNTKLKLVQGTKTNNCKECAMHQEELTTYIKCGVVKNLFNPLERNECDKMLNMCDCGSNYFIKDEVSVL